MATYLSSNIVFNRRPGAWVSSLGLVSQCRHGLLLVFHFSCHENYDSFGKMKNAGHTSSFWLKFNIAAEMSSDMEFFASGTHFLSIIYSGTDKMIQLGITQEGVLVLTASHNRSQDVTTLYIAHNTFITFCFYTLFVHFLALHHHPSHSLYPNLAVTGCGGQTRPIKNFH